MIRDEMYTLLMQGLGLKKEPVALKPLREIPADIPAYDGLATPGLCAQINEILTDGSVFYSTKRAARSAFIISGKKSILRSMTGGRKRWMV